MEIKNEKKLIRLSQNLEELIQGDTPQAIYDNFVILMKSQRDYFNSFSEDFLLSLVFFIYSYKKTQKFDLAKKMISNLFFIKLLYTDGEKFQTNCDNCYGEGYLDCDYCGGDGTQQCSTCDGTGEQQCSNCEGTGEIEDDYEEDVWHDCPDCKGKGSYTCYDCQGEGTESCDNCSGNGTESCHDCGGSGEVDSEEDLYEMLSICSWDNKIYNKCESKIDTSEPAFSYSQLESLNNKLIKLHTSEEHDELINNIEGDYYCFLLDRNIDIKYDLDKTSGMKITIYGYPDFYIQ